MSIGVPSGGGRPGRRVVRPDYGTASRLRRRGPRPHVLQPPAESAGDTDFTLPERQPPRAANAPRSAASAADGTISATSPPNEAISFTRLDDT